MVISHDHKHRDQLLMLL